MFRLLKRSAIPACGLVALAAALSAYAATTPPTATFGVDPSISTGGVGPTHTANDDFYQYTYTIPSGSALSDIIPIKVCLDGSTLGADKDGTVNWTDEVTVKNITGGFSGNVTVTPASTWSFSSSSNTVGDCQSATISIAIPAGTLNGNPGDGFATVIHFETQSGTPSTGPTKLQDSFDTPPDIGKQNPNIKLFVRFVPSNDVSCYITDSEGIFLLRSDGITPANASGDTTGTFNIIANKTKAVATNPGQFYYNLLWENPGGQTPVNVSLSLSGLVAHGSQAIHWLTFPTAGFAGITTANFDAVNEANPAGQNSPISVTVPAASTLYVTEHLEWTGIGQPAPTLPVTISIQGTVTPPGLSCTAGATGSLKQ